MLLPMNLNNLVLRPNCLLTKNPLVFIPGPRSLFFYRSPWGQLPQFLFEHGYVTLTLSLPFRSLLIRQLQFQNWLFQNKDKKFHFILDSLTFNELNKFLPNESTESVTVIYEKNYAQQPATSNFKNFYSWVPAVASTATSKYLLHQVFCRIFNTQTPAYSQTFSDCNLMNYNRFLDHCINLAENDVYA